MAAEKVKVIWRTADCVCFDVDSTVLVDEGIDELARFVGKGEEVSQITLSAMQGGMSYTEALRARLDIIRPSRKQVSEFIRLHPPRLTPRVKELVCALRERCVPVYLVSGGFYCILAATARILQIPLENVFANRLLFTYDGDYVTFDVQQPTCDGRGKAKVIENLKDRFQYKRLVHIGDGVTDMEASPPADAFIGFGGNQVREKVKVGCKWFVLNFDELILS